MDNTEDIDNSKCETLKEYFNGRISELEKQIELMKNCANCRHNDDFRDGLWISVKDRLPEPYEDIGCTMFSRNVLVFNGEDVSMNYVMYPHGTYGHNTTPKFSEGGYGKNDNITHWMPLPAPPQE